MIAMSEIKVQATGTFDIDRWEDSVYDEAEGGSLGRVVVEKSYHGDLEGRGTTNLLTAGTELGPAGYVGMERFTGSLRGRHGTFMLQHHAGLDGPDRGLAVAVVLPGSGTAELRGLSGRVRITIDEDGVHRWTLDYELRSPD
jgi:hypothetical protein